MEDEKELILAFLEYADPIYWGENDCTDRNQLVDQFLESKGYENRRNS